MEFNKEMSYSEVCHELDQPQVKSGRNRDLQLKRWQEKYEVEKVGRGRYVIKRQLSTNEIRDIQDSKNYSSYLQNMLLKYFANNEISHTYTYRDLREHLSMVNSHYFPTKYGQEKITLSMPCEVDINGGFCESDYDIIEEERKWFNIAESHDKDALRYAIEQLEKKELISSCTKSYVFYKRKCIDKDTTLIEKRIATSEEVAQIDQLKLNFAKKYGRKSANDLYGLGAEVMQEYTFTIQKYIKSIGYDRYARALTIVRPTELKRVVDYFAPKFNALQVQRYLLSKRFKALEPYIHQQLTEKLIKK